LFQLPADREKTGGWLLCVSTSSTPFGEAAVNSRHGSTDHLMLSLIRSRPAFTKTLLLLLLTMQAAGVIARMRASAAPMRNSSASATAEVHPSAGDATRALDRFLNHHPLLEEQLRISPQLADDATFLARNPDLRDFARSNPDAIKRVSADPRHLLYRALLRQAHAALPMREMAVFDEVFDREPALERALNANPELIRDAAFLQRQPALKKVFRDQPRLAAAFTISIPANKTN
jgi:hypothetical protein